MDFQQHTQQNWIIALDRHKKGTPDTARSRGFYRLLPQLVGSFDPGSGCRGMGAARVGPINPNSRPTRITCNLAAPICLPVAPGATVCPAGKRLLHRELLLQESRRKYVLSTLGFGILPEPLLLEKGNHWARRPAFALSDGRPIPPQKNDDHPHAFALRRACAARSPRSPGCVSCRGFVFQSIQREEGSALLFILGTRTAPNTRTTSGITGLGLSAT